MKSQFSKAYPDIAYWVEACGWIEIGPGEHSSSLVRALDEGSLIWESSDDHTTVDEALQALEIELAEWLEQLGTESVDPNSEQNGSHACESLEGNRAGKVHNK